MASSSAHILGVASPLRSSFTPFHIYPPRPRLLCFSSPSQSPSVSVGQGKYERNPAMYWEKFYHRHHDKFFKDRHYLEKDWGRYFSSANEGACDSASAPSERKIVLEAGCGAGNTVFPLLAKFPHVHVHACDFSPYAISLVKANGSFSSERVNAFVCDLAINDLSKEICPSSVNVATMIFMLSAVSPEKMPLILQNIRKVLKGKLASKNQMIRENFYVRGDGTCAFYFSEDSLSKLFRECGFCTVEVSVYSKQIENRHRKVVMERHWIRAVFCNSNFPDS